MQIRFAGGWCRSISVSASWTRNGMSVAGSHWYPVPRGRTASGKATTAPCSPAQDSIRLRRACRSAVDRVPCRPSTTALGVAGSARRYERLEPPTEMLWRVAGTRSFCRFFVALAGSKLSIAPDAHTPALTSFPEHPFLGGDAFEGSNLLPSHRLRLRSAPPRIFRGRCHAIALDFLCWC